MKKHFGITLVVLMISLLVSACGNRGDRGGGVRATPAFTVGGVVSGLTGTVVLQINGGDNLSISADGPFTFPTATAAGTFYNVTVQTNPPGQTCLVSNGEGTLIVSNVTNVSVECFQNGGPVITFNPPNGFTVQDNTAGGNGNDTGSAVAIDARGRIVVTGSSTNSAGNTDMVLWRFNADGSLDTDFNGSGFVVYSNAAGGNSDDAGNAVAIDFRGRILVAGSSTNGAGNADMVIWRFNGDGTLDTTFNGTGFVVHNGAAGGNGDDVGNAVAVDAQHRVLVAGSSTNSAGNADMVIWRFNANGTTDTGLAGGGFVVHNGAAGGSGDDFGKAIALDSQGKIFVAGSSGNGAANADMTLWRFNANGSLDTTFNGSGFIAHDSAAGGNGDDFGNAIALDSQGRVLIAGSSRNSAGNDDLAIWRIDADGKLDPAFNGGGIVINNGAAGGNGDDAGRAVTIDSQERIVVSGGSGNRAGDFDMTVWRFTPGGAIDTSYAEDGIAARNGSAGGNADDFGNAVAIIEQGRIVVAGSSNNSAGNADMAVWELFP